MKCSIFGEKLYLGPISIGKNGFELFFSFLAVRINSVNVGKPSDMKR